MENLDRIITAAHGYAELGMHAEAMAELDSLGDDMDERLEVRETRLMIFMRGKKWKEGLEISRSICAASPESSGGFIHAAFCLHELGRTEEARQILMDGPETLEQEPTHFYNLACYELALGDREAALRHLVRSFKMNKKLKEFARTDPDLEAIRDLI